MCVAAVRETRTPSVVRNLFVRVTTQPCGFLLLVRAMKKQAVTVPLLKPSRLTLRAEAVPWNAAAL